MVIWKYEVPITDSFSLKVPGYKPRVLSFGLDPFNTPCVWILVEPKEPEFTIQFRVFGTGNPIEVDSDIEFVGTLKQGPYMWHLFQE